MSGPSYQITKRVLDVLGALIALLPLGVLYCILGAAIKLDTPGPVLVALDRVSRGKTIKLYKFRSMVANAHSQKDSLRHLNERDEPFFKIKKDPRVTHVGKIIRTTRLDEFPQIINVLRGELSLVGPRPHEPGEVTQYPAEFKFIAQAKAGVTGLSQISGASSLPFRRELELDSTYLRTQSLIGDLRILGKTLAIFLFDPSAV